MTQPSREQFTDWLAEHGGQLHKVAMTYARSPEDREDLTQEILVQLWRSSGSYDPQRPFATWMYRVALNVAISHVRRATRGGETFAELGEDPADPRSVPAETSDRMHILQRLMSDLDELDRALLLLHLEERSYRDIADVLGLSESNVGTKLNRIRQRLRQLATVEMAR